MSGTDTKKALRGRAPAWLNLLETMIPQLGHRSIQVTVDIYGHAVPGGNRAAVDRLDDAPLTALDITPAAPHGAAADHANALSAVESVVSRVRIEPER